MACCATLQSDVVIEAEIEEEPDAANHPVTDHVATVSRIVDLTPTIKVFFSNFLAWTAQLFRQGNMSICKCLGLKISPCLFAGKCTTNAEFD